MANIANNSYMFYGDKTELTKCHEELSKLYEKDNGRFSCVHETENVVVNGEWIEYIEELFDDADSFSMYTTSKWYGNPVYWHNWVKNNYPKLSVAFYCEEPAMDIFDQIDPDNVLQDRVWVEGLNIPADDLSKLPQEIRGCAGKDGDDTYYLCGSFDKDELFNSDFKPADVPESITVREYTNTTYDALMAEQKRILSEFWSKYDK